MIEDIKDKWSSQGRRVILLARKIVSREQTRSNDLESEMMKCSRTGLTLVGLVSIVDPPREEIPQVVYTLRGAGIRIFMACSPNLRGPKAPSVDVLLGYR